jgi:hypothetical protein
MHTDDDNYSRALRRQEIGRNRKDPLHRMIKAVSRQSDLQMTLLDIKKLLREEGNQPLESCLSPAPLPISKFHRFSELPAELRIQIWRYSLPSPRIFRVDFAQQVEHMGTYTRFCRPKSVILRGIGPLRQLFVCRESHQEAISVYQYRHAFYNCSDNSGPKLCLASDPILVKSEGPIAYLYSDQQSISWPTRFKPHSEVQSLRVLKISMRCLFKGELY